MDQMGAILESLLNQVRSMCTHCGMCCRHEIFFLAEFEAPIIACKLLAKGGVPLVQAHIRRNPTIFNKWGRHIFFFGQECPFHQENRCSVYSDRPMCCRLYPFKLVAFTDNRNREVRRPNFAPAAGRSTYACTSASEALIDQLNSVSRIDPHLGMTAIDFIVASLLNTDCFAFCFGQAKERGDQSIDTTEMVFASEIELDQHVIRQFEKAYGVVVKDWKSHCISLTDDEVSSLASQERARKLRGKTTKRLARMEQDGRPILEWYRQIHPGT